MAAFQPTVLKMLGFDTGTSTKLPAGFMTITQEPINVPLHPIHMPYVSKNPKWQPLPRYGPDQNSDTMRMKPIDINQLFNPNKEDFGLIEKEVNWYKSFAGEKDKEYSKLNQTKLCLEDDIRRAQHYECDIDNMKRLEEENCYKQAEASNLHQMNNDLECENERLERAIQGMSTMHVRHEPEVIYHSEYPVERNSERVYVKREPHSSEGLHTSQHQVRREYVQGPTEYTSSPNRHVSHQPHEHSYVNHGTENVTVKRLDPVVKYVGPARDSLNHSNVNHSNVNHSNLRTSMPGQNPQYRTSHVSEHQPVTRISRSEGSQIQGTRVVQGSTVHNQQPSRIEGSNLEGSRTYYNHPNTQGRQSNVHQNNNGGDLY